MADTNGNSSIVFLARRDVLARAEFSAEDSATGRAKRNGGDLAGAASGGYGYGYCPEGIFLDLFLLFLSFKLWVIVKRCNYVKKHI